MALSLPGRKGKKSQPDTEATSDETASSTAENAQSTASGKLKPRQRLASVVRESNVGPAVELMRTAPNFVLDDPDPQQAVVLLLDVTDIGGLSMKQRNDEDKGQLIELINHDQIQVFTSKDMIENEQLAFILTERTIHRMDEFSLLVKAPYRWALVTLDGQADVTPLGERSIDLFHQAQVVGQGAAPIVQIVGPLRTAQAAQAAHTPAPAQSKEVSSQTVQAAAVAAGEPVNEAFVGPSRSETPVEQAETDAGYDADDVIEDAGDDEGEHVDPFADEPDDGDEGVDPTGEDEPVEGADDSEYDDGNVGDEGYDEPVADDGVVVSPDEVHETTQRRFFSHDLDLVLDMTPFDEFVKSSVVSPPFPDMKSGGTWLTEHVNELVRTANGEVSQLHSRHVDVLRESYLQIMNTAAEKISSEFDLSDPGSRYGKLAAMIVSDYEESRRNGSSEISSRTREKQADYDKRREDFGEAARQQALATYDDRNLPTLERQISDIAPSIEKEIQDKRAGREEFLDNARSKDAGRYFDLEMNRAISALATVRQEQAESEAALTKDWAAKIAKFIDENRKNDVAHDEALAEDLVRRNKVEDVTNDFTQRIEALTASHEKQVTELQGQLERSQAAADAVLAEREETLRTHLDAAKHDAKASSDRAQTLEKELSTVDARYKAKHDEAVAALEADRAKMQSEVATARETQSKNVKLILWVAVFMVLIALGVGFLLGFVL